LPRQNKQVKVLHHYCFPWHFREKTILKVQTFWKKKRIIIIFLFFLLGLGFELRALHLQSKHSTVWLSLSSFCSAYFGDGVL
jgi:hypothetical protein